MAFPPKIERATSTSIVADVDGAPKPDPLIALKYGLLNRREVPSCANNELSIIPACCVVHVTIAGV